MPREIEKQIDRQINRQIDRWIDGWRDRQIDREMYIMRCDGYVQIKRKRERIKRGRIRNSTRGND